MNLKVNLGNLGYLLSCVALVAVRPSTALVWAAALPPVSASSATRRLTRTSSPIGSISRHCELQVGCEDCHGDAHQATNNVAKVKIPTPDTCGECHEPQVKQFKKGKHAAGLGRHEGHAHHSLAADGHDRRHEGLRRLSQDWAEDAAGDQGVKPTGGGFGVASCDACHTRHTFSVKEARQPQACQTCHMGFDHPQWEMYSASKHGVRALSSRAGCCPRTRRAPTCQTCHMQEGNHEVRTAWGFLAVRLPMPEDKQWAADRATILQALGVLDPDGQPTAPPGRREGSRRRQADPGRLAEASATRCSQTCNQCHSGNFAKQQLEQGDDMIKEADRLMAEAIRIVAGALQGWPAAQAAELRLRLPRPADVP